MTTDNTFALDGRKAIVTGASSGIGAGIARALSEAGAAVALVGRDEGRLRAVAEPLRAGSAIIPVDLRDDDAPAAIVAVTMEQLGGIDVIVHCAGLFFPKPFDEISAAELDGQWQVNVRAPFLLTQAALPHLEAGASVIFVSSMMGMVGGAMCTAYCATKGAVEQLSKGLAVELGERGIRFNTVAPGAVETPMNEGFREDASFYESFRDFAPAKRWGRVEDIAPAVVFLAGTGASFIHGARIAVDGGWVAR